MKHRLHESRAGAGTAARQRWCAPFPAISYTGGTRPGWLLHLLLDVIMAGAPLAGPQRGTSWLVAGLGAACVASAVAFRTALTDADAWRTGERVSVSWASWAWFNLHKFPFVAILLAGLAASLDALLTR